MDSIKINKVILFGDSVIFGAGANHRKQGCGILLRSFMPEITVTIKGRNKDTTRRGLERVKTDILDDKDCTHVIVLFGNNDCRLKDIDKPLVSLSEYKENLKIIIKQIESSNRIPLIANLQPINSEMFYRALPEMSKFIVTVGPPHKWQEKYSIICEEIASSEEIKLIDIRSALVKYGDDIFAKDGLHPNDFGHKIIAQNFFEALKEFM
ncbi:MAG TPA: hypothetical protein ENH41_04195 [Candidatus Omnitrophica bacterium]|nr:hypothetical protein [Candidatus Omnitrophota bacterium]